MFSDDILSAYTDPEAAQARIDSAPTLRDRLALCTIAVDVCDAPQGRFGLTSVAGDVAAVYSAALAQCRLAAAPYARRLAAAYDMYQAWDSAWAELGADAGGFGPGDSNLLLSVIR